MESSFNDRLAASLDQMSPAAQRVALYFRDNPEEVLIAPATALAEKTATSDATVVRTAKALGFSGMEELRRALAREIRATLSPAGRVARTLVEMGDDLGTVLESTLDIHRRTLDELQHNITGEAFKAAVHAIAGARRVFIFGLGPSSAMAEYLAIQLGRFGIDTVSLTHTGLLLADGLHRLTGNDLLLIFAYGRVYGELTALLDQADRCGAAHILCTDTLGPALRGRVDTVLPVPRGRSDMLSMHTGTLALIEALLVGVAVERPEQTLASLESLNRTRAMLAGRAMDIPAP